ncbi:hypothetical protein CR513_61517, partial [Mucuna pruriens]
MNILEYQRWMYRRLDGNKHWMNEFIEGVYGFLQFAIAQEKFKSQGFMPNYYWWTNHCEELPQFPPMKCRTTGRIQSLRAVDHGLCWTLIAQAQLWEGCDNHSKLSISLIVLSLKFFSNM